MVIILKMKIGKHELSWRKVEPANSIGRPRVNVDEELIFKLHNDGMSLRKIAEATGISKSSVDRILKR